MLVNDDIRAYARSLGQDCGIESIHVFISDKTTKDTRIHCIGNWGVDEEVLHRYKQAGICDIDPFIDTLVNEGVGIDDRAFREVNNPNVTRCGTRAEAYWQFVSDHDVDVVGAATMRLQPRLYLTVGAHRARRKHHASSVPVEQLGFGIQILQDRVAANLLTVLLAGGRGYRTLMTVMNAGNADEDTKHAELSARETEVARLVCEGKQNKEIAWLAKLSEYTVENHLRRIYQKLGIHNRAALVARMNGILA